MSLDPQDLITLIDERELEWLVGGYDRLGD